ncbi:MAG: YihY/virulence factor BrkB family protein [Gemmatimonadaceae bacterium]|nr:YihY/virulence factor BrkB family protein [Gemmatimonadaceae bacterium]
MKRDYKVWGGYSVGPLLKKTGREIIKDNVLGLAAQTAYYFFFSLFPLLLFVAPVLSIIGNKQEMIGWLLDKLARAVPPAAMTMVSGVVKDVVLSPSAPGVMSVGALLAAWSGSNIFGALMGALNNAYDTRETRPWVKQQLIRFAALGVAGLVLILATAIMLGGAQIADWLGQTLNLSHATTQLWKFVQYPLALSILVGSAWLLFYFLPNVKQRPVHVLVAAVVTTVLWVVGTLLFRAYVANFGSYNKTYGTIGGVIALLTWMYLSMLILLCGGELASELHCGTARVEADQGASYAGRIGTHGQPGLPSSERVERAQPLAARAPE